MANAYKFMKREADGVSTDLKTPQERATGISERSLKRTMKEMKTTASGASTSFVTLHKEKLVSCPISTPANFNKCVIHGTVNDFQIADKQRPM
jgi:hypothetical protein